MAYDYTAELQRAYDRKLASFRPVPPEPSIPDLTTSLPRGMSDHEIEEAERSASIAHAQNAGKSLEEI